MTVDVIGIGEADVPAAARALIEGADVLVGGERHLALIGFGPAQRHVWPKPFAKAKALLDGLGDARIVVLASGDPMWFGVGATLMRWFGPDKVRIHPHPGAFSLAAARMGWALHETQCLSAHGRPIEALRVHLAPGRKWLVLAEDGETASRLARLLAWAGYGPSIITVLSHLDGPLEATKSDNALNWQGNTPDLSVLAVSLAAQPGRALTPLVAGLPDAAFEHDGQLTKRVIRAATLSALAPLPGLLLWDVGAGSGSVAIEWMRAGGQAVAIEADPVRAARIARNALSLGVPDLEIVEATAPDGLPSGAPDAIFVGGGVSDDGLLVRCWERLKPGGRMVANAVTLESEAALIAFFQAHGGELVRLSYAHLDAVGDYHAWASARPVTQYSGVKA